jgi:hypothetical protein
MLGPIWYLLHNIETRMPQNHDSKKTPCAKTNKMRSIPITRSSKLSQRYYEPYFILGVVIWREKKVPFTS